MTTLKEKHASRKLKLLQERLHRIDKKVIIGEIKYGPRDLLLLEALDPKQSAIAFDIIKKLSATDFEPITAFNTVKTAVLDDVKKVLAGGGKDPVRAIANFFKKLTGKGEQLNDDPLTSAMAFVDSTRNFFEDMTKLIDSMKLPEDVSIKQGITGQDKEGEATAGARQAMNASTKSDKDAQKQIKLMSDIIKKSLRPDFDASKLGQGWIRKYLPGLTGGKGLQSIVKDILETTPKVFKEKAALVSKEFANAAAEGEKIAASAGKGSDPVAGEQGKETTQSTPGGANAPNVPSTTGAAKGPGENKLKDDHVESMAGDFAKKLGVDKAVTLKILSALNSNGKLKESVLRHQTK